MFYQSRLLNKSLAISCKKREYIYCTEKLNLILFNVGGIGFIPFQQFRPQKTTMLVQYQSTFNSDINYWYMSIIVQCNSAISIFSVDTRSKSSIKWRNVPNHHYQNNWSPFCLSECNRAGFCHVSWLCIHSYCQRQRK